MYYHVCEYTYNHFQIQEENGPPAEPWWQIYSLSCDREVVGEIDDSELSYIKIFPLAIYR